MVAAERRRRARPGQHPRPPPRCLPALAHRTPNAGHEGPEPELEPLPTIDELRQRWQAEWVAVDAWLPTLTDGHVQYVHEGVPVWQMLVHVVNHGTQHRAEAAALLTGEGRSPGELDLINYAEERAGGGNTDG